MKRFSDAGRLGAYLRVVRRGTLRAGDAVEVTFVPEGAPSILDAYRGV